MLKLSITAPNDLNLLTAACGHGWYDLAPFSFDRIHNVLKYTFAATDREACTISITQRNGKLIVLYDNDRVDVSEIRRAIVRILRLDIDLTDLYRLTDTEKSLQWVKRIGAGRLLRSSTVFEDLIKTICTTNCTWSLTKSMVTNIVEKLGISSPSGERSFPDPAAFAAVDADFFRSQIKSGYRSEYLVELGQKVVSGEIDLEAFLVEPMAADVLKKKLLAIKGVGNYAAEHMLKLLGHYEHLALDSWIRAEYYKLHRNGNKCEDSEIAEHYGRFGKWKGLALWCDVTGSWFDQSVS